MKKKPVKQLVKEHAQIMHALRVAAHHAGQLAYGQEFDHYSNWSNYFLALSNGNFTVKAPES